jgi:hypothetical protein
MTLNVTNTMSGALFGFSWNVTDPSGTQSSFFSAGAANGPVLTLTAVYPRDFSGASVKYNGTYRVNIFQTYPSPTTLVTTGKFYAGLTDNLSYQRTALVSITAQGYVSNENVTIRMLHAGAQASGFPKYQLASGNGVVNYLWPIPVSTPIGAWNVTLTGQTTAKKPTDSQVFTITPTTVSISQLVVNVTQVQSSQIAAFTFTATYPDGSQAKTGNATIRVLEPIGTNVHPVTLHYNTTINAYEGTYQLTATSPAGGWAGIIDPNALDDGYGNVGPSTTVVRGFAVQPIAPQNSQATTVTYLLLTVLLLVAALIGLLSWIWFFGGKKVRRSVLKVDFQSIEREAARVENRDFYTKVHDQLKQRNESTPKEENKDG